MAESNPPRLIATNKKAYHDYFVEDTFEAGISLAGTEVKSIRQGGVNLKDSFCSVEKGEMVARNLRISPYEKGNIFNRDPMRPKILLLHKREIMRIQGLAGRQGYSIIPLKLYWKGPHVKVEIGLCKGKKLYDKRDSEAEKQRDLDNRRFLRNAAKEV